MGLSSVAVPFANTHIFARIFLDYVNGSSDLTPFYSFSASVEGIEKASALKKFSLDKRQTLVRALMKQYSEVSISELVKSNIEALKEETTFTITTGHQLCLGTGPLYVIYKILTAIRLAEEMNQLKGSRKYIPVFWMATEDHDIEEISHFYLFTKKVQWETQQLGPAGRLETESLQAIWESLQEKIPSFEIAYSKGKTLAEATRWLLNDLFGQYGLVIIDGDEKELKREFIPIISEDILNGNSFMAVTKSSKALDELHYPTQAKPREINFFYIEGHSRERLVKEGEIFKVLNRDIQFTVDELKSEINQYPQKFSPNVILRPLYQDTVLPNVVYVPGPGELAYWLQLKSVYDYYQEIFPVIFPRQHNLIVTVAQQNKWEKLGFDIDSLFEGEAQLTKKLLGHKADSEVDFTDEENLLSSLGQQLLDKILPIDKSLQGAVEAELTKMKGMLSGLLKKVQKAQKDKHEVELKQISSLLAKWFPEGQPQERIENLMTFYLNRPELIKELHAVCNPFDFQFHILMEDDQK
jgi:bacillithiol biosynthesis cysteine-adding enzyme BshC